jgi:hypothetical protein
MAPAYFAGAHVANASARYRREKNPGSQEKVTGGAGLDQ